MTKTFIVEVKKDFMNAAIDHATFRQIATGVVREVSSTVSRITGYLDAAPGGMRISQDGNTVSTWFKGTDNVADEVRKIANVHSVTERKP